MRLNQPTFVGQECEPAELCMDDIAGYLTAADAGIRANLDGSPVHLFNGAANDEDGTLTETQRVLNVKVGGPGALLSLPHSFG